MPTHACALCPALCCRYIADVLCEFRNSKMAKEGWQSRLLFKKRMFRETDESITEPQFVNLSYVQVRTCLLLPTASSPVPQAERPAHTYPHYGLQALRQRATQAIGATAGLGWELCKRG